MSVAIEEKLNRIPIVKQLVFLLKKLTLPHLHGLSVYDLLEIYLIGIFKGALSYRASAVAFSFFMSLFPFTLFILNLIPYIPINGFQQDFLDFVKQSVPPSTYEAIFNIINDILHNSHSGLLSVGFFITVFLMANGVNAILGGFENSHHLFEDLKRNFFKQYLVSLALSILLSFLLLITVASIFIFEYFIQQTRIPEVLSDKIQLIQIGRYCFIVSMILVATSLLFKFGVKREKNRSFISIGSVFTTILIIFSSYFFGIWVIKFSKYNELYGSIGTLLIIMFYIWINCILLLLGFDLNTAINKIKRLQKTNTRSI